MNFEEIGEDFKQLDTSDVAEKRLKMFKIFEELVSIRTEEDSSVEGLEVLKESDGYMYKLSQDFLLSSSTMDKENKLEKILEYFERKDYA